MKNKIIFLGFLMFLIMGMAGLNIFWMDTFMPEERKPMVMERRPSVAVKETFNEKEGWGFVKARNGKMPEVTAHQRTLVKKYNALFIGNAKEKKITLTFDMGYEKEGLTPKILATLKKYNVRAAFFVTTHWIEKNPELAKRVISEGHVMGNHTVKHKSLPTLSDEEVKSEILGWEEVAKQVANYTIKHKYMRPPMGEYSERTLKLTKDLGYRTAFWSIAIKDWLPMGGPDKAIQGITDQLHNGAVVLLHGNSEDVASGLEQIIIQARAKGYKLVPIYEI